MSVRTRTRLLPTQGAKFVFPTVAPTFTQSTAALTSVFPLASFLLGSTQLTSSIPRVRLSVVSVLLTWIEARLNALSLALSSIQPLLIRLPYRFARTPIAVSARTGSATAQHSIPA